MMKRISPRLVAGLIVLIAPALARAQWDVQSTRPLVIALAAEARCDDAIVYLGQIARISGGTIATRLRLGAIDIADLKIGAERASVSSDQVRFRLLLAGLTKSQFRLTGAQRVEVTASVNPIGARRIAAEAEAALRQKYPGLIGKMFVSVANDVNAPRITVKPKDRVELEARPPSLPPRPGRVKVDVSVIINGRTREIVPVHLELTAAFAGQSTPKSAGPIRLASNFTPDPEPNEVLIKNRDMIKIIAYIGSVRILADAEAQQDGRIGDVIRVRNTSSNRIVRGRVESRSSVEAVD